VTSSQCIAAGAVWDGGFLGQLSVRAHRIYTLHSWSVLQKAAIFSANFCGVVCESLQEEVGVILKLPDQKTQGFLVLIAFKRLFPVHTRKVFDKIPVRI
jgi:hypothetical protein